MTVGQGGKRGGNRGNAKAQCQRCKRWMRRRPTVDCPATRRESPHASHCTDCPLPLSSPPWRKKERPSPFPYREITGLAVPSWQPSWQPLQARPMLLPFTCECLPASLVQIPVRLDRPFRGTRLVVATSCAAAFEILRLGIGPQRDFFAGYAPEGRGISGELFPPLPENVDPSLRRLYEKLLAIDLPTATMGMSITLDVLNLTSSTLTFHAGLWGVTVECP